MSANTILKKSPMAKRKKDKIAAIHDYPNVFQNFSFEVPQLVDSEKKEIDYRGKWRQEVFGNDHPLILELACGRGDYTIGMAGLFPEKNIIGIDLKGARIYTGAKHALEQGMKNVAFLRSNIFFLAKYFEPGEVDEIWITFPDPFPRKSDAKHRLTSPRFLKVYEQIVKPGGDVHLKTDAIKLFHYSAETIKEEGFPIAEYMEDIYAKGDLPEVLKLKTYYEGMHLADGRTINYLRFTNKRKSDGAGS